MLSYDYTVLAGTQGALGHRKKDRLFELIERMRLPTVFFAEGGGGRPGDTDYPVVSALDTRAFALWARLSGLVPRIAVVAGRCFAGNAVIAGCSDLIVATENVSIGMGGPGDDRRRRPRRRRPRRRRPDRDAGAQRRRRRRRRRRGARPSAVTKRLLGYFQGDDASGAAPDQSRLRDLVPERAAARLPRRADHRDAGRRRLGHVPARAVRARDGDRPRADRGPGGRRHREQHDAHGGRDHERRGRQGRAVPAALRRLRPAASSRWSTPPA